jgi:TolB protein
VCRRFLLVALIAVAAAVAALAAGGAGTAVHGAFPGRNGRIVFARWLHGNSDLWTTDLHGRLRRLARTVDSEEDPAWSPNGRRIVFERDPLFGSSDGDLYTIAANGTGLRRITTDSAGEFSPSWSPNGKQVVYVNAIGQITVAKADGTGAKTHLTHNSPPAYDGWPKWSPDGKKILFEGQGHISVMNADGTAQRILIKKRGAGAASWSPDGRKIVFVARPGFWIANKDGSHLHLLPRPRSRHGPLGWPEFSPNGKLIAFSYATSAGRDLFVMRADATHVRRVTHGADPPQQVDWQSLVY